MTAAINIPGKRLDERVEQILRDPKTYFERARRNVRAEVKAERRQADRHLPRAAEQPFGPRQATSGRAHRLAGPRRCTAPRRDTVLGPEVGEHLDARVAAAVAQAAVGVDQHAVAEREPVPGVGAR